MAEGSSLPKSILKKPELAKEFASLFEPVALDIPTLTFSATEPPKIHTGPQISKENLAAAAKLLDEADRRVGFSVAETKVYKPGNTVNTSGALAHQEAAKKGKDLETFLSSAAEKAAVEYATQHGYATTSKQLVQITTGSADGEGCATLPLGPTSGSGISDTGLDPSIKAKVAVTANGGTGPLDVGNLRKDQDLVAGKSDRPSNYPVSDGRNHASVPPAYDGESDLDLKKTTVVPPPWRQINWVKEGWMWPYIWKIIALCAFVAFIWGTWNLAYTIGWHQGAPAHTVHLERVIENLHQQNARLESQISHFKSINDSVEDRMHSCMTNLRVAVSDNAQHLTNIQRYKDLTGELSDQVNKVETLGARQNEELALCKQSLSLFHSDELMAMIDMLQLTTRWWHYILWVVVATIHFCMNPVSLTSASVLFGQVATGGALTMLPWSYALGPWSAIVALDAFRIILVAMSLLGWIAASIAEGKFVQLGVNLTLSVGFNIATWFMDKYGMYMEMPPLHAAVMMLFMTLGPIIMKAGLWAQGSVHIVTNFMGKTVTNEQNILQKLLWTYMGLTHAPNPTPISQPQPKPTTGKQGLGYKRPRAVLEGARSGLQFIADAFATGTKVLEAAFGQPWINLKVVEKSTPWSVIDGNGLRVGCGFHWKGAFVTPHHVWQSVGQTNIIEVLTPTGVKHQLTHVGKFSGGAEKLEAFRPVPGTKSLMSSKMQGVVQCFAVVQNGTPDNGVTFGTLDTNKQTHDCTTQPGDSGTPICDNFGKVLGIHYCSTPGANHVVGIDAEVAECLIVSGDLCPCKGDECGCTMDGDIPECSVTGSAVETKSLEARAARGPAGRKFTPRQPKTPQKRRPRKMFTEEEYDHMVRAGIDPRDIKILGDQKWARVIRSADEGWREEDDDGYYFESTDTGIVASVKPTNWEQGMANFDQERDYQWGGPIGKWEHPLPISAHDTTVLRCWQGITGDGCRFVVNDNVDPEWGVQFSDEQLLVIAPHLLAPSQVRYDKWKANLVPDSTCAIHCSAANRKMYIDPKLEPTSKQKRMESRATEVRRCHQLGEDSGECIGVTVPNNSDTPECPEMGCTGDLCRTEPFQGAVKSAWTCSNTLPATPESRSKNSLPPGHTLGKGNGEKNLKASEFLIQKPAITEAKVEPQLHTHVSTALPPVLKVSDPGITLLQEFLGKIQAIKPSNGKVKWGNIRDMAEEMVAERQTLLNGMIGTPVSTTTASLNTTKPPICPESIITSQTPGSE